MKFRYKALIPAALAALLLSGCGALPSASAGTDAGISAAAPAKTAALSVAADTNETAASELFSCASFDAHAEFSE